MISFHIQGRCIADPPPADWREQLSARLGVIPRRLGGWTELGLYGALECMADAGEQQFPATASLVLSSRLGPSKAMRNLLEQGRVDLPMPLTFLQSQPNQLLASVAAHLRWCGDARFITHPDPRALLRLVAAQNRPDGVLIGWVEDAAAGRSVWLRLRPCETPAETVCELEALGPDLLTASHVHIAPLTVPNHQMDAIRP